LPSLPMDLQHEQALIAAQAMEHSLWPSSSMLHVRVGLANRQDHWSVATLGTFCTTPSSYAPREKQGAQPNTHPKQLGEEWP
jgi:hypothetical protein